MKYLKNSLWHLIFFLLLFIVSYKVELDKDILNGIKLILVIIISIIQIKFLNVKIVFNHVLYNIISLTIIYELYKIMEFQFGFLPKYFEIPFIWRILISLVAFCLYTIVLVLIQRLCSILR